MALLSRLQQSRTSPHLQNEMQDHRALYSILWDHYLCNGLYDDINTHLRNDADWGEAMRPLHNPANRAVEFYVAKLAAGPLDSALPLITTNVKLTAAIKRIWRWSNFGSTKQLLARFFACLGDGYIKVAQSGDTPENTRIFFQILDPRWVCDLDKDERGFVVSVRINVPRETTDERGRVVVRWWTEVWTPDTMRIWEAHDKSDAPTNKLGTPTKEEVNTLGFVPIVHAPFRDIGETYGMGCFVQSLDKIEESSRMCTRLHSMMFRYNKPIWSVETEATGGGKDAFGRPKPPKMPDAGEITIGDDSLLAMPVGSKLNPLVPDIDWTAYLKTIEAMDTEIRSDQPELEYYTLVKDTQSSGIAIRYKLGAAIDRVVEARGNLYTALVRANQIACTMAQRAGVAGFSVEDIGTYESGALDHEIGETPVIPLSPRDQADTVDILVRSGVKRSIAMKRNGFTDEEIAEQEAYEKTQQVKTPASVVPTGVASEPDEVATTTQKDGEPTPVDSDL